MTDNEKKQTQAGSESHPVVRNHLEDLIKASNLASKVDLTDPDEIQNLALSMVQEKELLSKAEEAYTKIFAVLHGIIKTHLYQ